ncbi:hypothetical protein PQR15_03505 [Streptomyces lydicus]|nr:hypothetical protein [Streptomyces lydicus]
MVFPAPAGPVTSVSGPFVPSVSRSSSRRRLTRPRRTGGTDNFAASSGSPDGVGEAAVMGTTR